MKKIKVNTEVVKERLNMPTDRGVIVVNNPSNEFKNDIIEYMVSRILEDGDFDERKIMLDLIDNCTNVEFDMDVFEAKNLSHEAKMITNEILIIFQEIVGEAGQIVKLILQQTKNELEQKEVEEENKKLLNQIEEMVEEKDAPQEVEEYVPQKTVRKPQRSKGRVVRR